jgi:alpha-ketoglutarate-dependent taurine dioxygenase
METNTSADLQAPIFSPRRRVIVAGPADLVTFEQPLERQLPLMAHPSISGVDLAAWAGLEREQIQSRLLRHGAILFRGFDIKSPSEFETFIVAVSGDPLPYLERSSPRTQVNGNIYSSTEYPADRSIFLHSENSYQESWPLKIFFWCQTPARVGGATPLADTRRILCRIIGSVRDSFERKGITYVRNFGNGLGLPWQSVFQTDDPVQVENYCSSRGIRCEWLSRDRLRTLQVRKATQTHPVTGEPVWFNHAVFFHISTLDPAIGNALNVTLAEDDLPNNTYYGDGSAIEPEVLDHLRAVYREETASFEWRQGDVLMADNMLVAHGRDSYHGARKVLVGMTEPHSA